jgi:hypothetical protein
VLQRVGKPVPLLTQRRAPMQQRKPWRATRLSAVALTEVDRRGRTRQSASLQCNSAPAGKTNRRLPNSEPQNTEVPFMIRYSSFVTLRFLYIAHPFSSAAHRDGSPYRLRMPRAKRIRLFLIEDWEGRRIAVLLECGDKPSREASAAPLFLIS